MTSTIAIPKDIVKAIIRCFGHIGGHTCTKDLLPYIFGRRSETGSHIFDIIAQWDAIIIAARLFCSIKNPSDILVISSGQFGKKAVQRFCEYTGATAHTGRFIPGSFTNQRIAKVCEPQLIIVSDPDHEKNPIWESGVVNIKTIGFCNSDNPINLIDCVIPFNNRSLYSIGAGYCVLAKVINYMKGNGELDDNINAEIERYFYRNAAELEVLAAEKEDEKKNEARICEDEPITGESE